MLRFFLIGFLGLLLLVVGVVAAVGGWGWWVLVALLESVRPEIQQYFVERNFDGRPFDRDVRTVVYERAKGIHGELSFGTERDLDEIGYEYLVHSTMPVPEPEHHLW